MLITNFYKKYFYRGLIIQAMQRIVDNTYKSIKLRLEFHSVCVQRALYRLNIDG